MVVGGGDEAHPRCGIARGGDLCRHLESRQVPPLARLGPLPHLDLQKIGGVEKIHIDAKPSGGDLLAAVFPVAPQHVCDFASLTVHADDVEAACRFGIDAEGGLPLGTEAHGGKEDRQVVAADGGINFVGVDAQLFLKAEVDEMTDGQGIFSLQLADQARQVGIGLIHLGHGADHLPDPWIEAELHRDRLLFPAASHSCPAAVFLLESHKRQAPMT